MSDHLDLHARVRERLTDEVLKTVERSAANAPVSMVDDYDWDAINETRYESMRNSLLTALSPVLEEVERTAQSRAAVEQTIKRLMTGIKTCIDTWDRDIYQSPARRECRDALLGVFLDAMSHHTHTRSSERP